MLRTNRLVSMNTTTTTTTTLPSTRKRTQFRVPHEKRRMHSYNSNMLLRVVLVVLPLLVSFQQQPQTHYTAQAFPTGVGSCAGTNDAVGGIHLIRDTVIHIHDLNSLGIQVIVGGSSYNSGSYVPLLPSVEYGITVAATDPAFFRGILIRLTSIDGQDMTGTMISKTNTILTSRCPLPYTIGLSHTNSTIKTVASGRFRTDHPGRIQMDISVVAGNEPTISLYGSSNYTLDVIDPGLALSPTTFRPISPPTNSPILAAVPVPTVAIAPILAFQTTTTSTTTTSSSSGGGSSTSTTSTDNRIDQFRQSSSSSSSTSSSSSGNSRTDFSDLGDF